MTINELTEKDIRACAQVFVEIFNDEPWNDQWTFERALTYITEFFQTPNFQGYLAMDGDDIIGFIYGVKRSWWSGDEFFIHEMGVKPAYHGQEIGYTLLDHLSKELDDKVAYLSLLTDRGMPAEAFYQKNGFEEIERLVFYSKDVQVGETVKK